MVGNMFTRYLILGLWLLWALYWLVAARTAKPVRKREPLLMRLAFIAQALLTAILLGHHSWSGWLGVQLIHGGWTRYGIAVMLIVIGLTISIWARRILGGNWSGSVTVKEGHELVQSGPYRYVRHPIYSGLLLMILGTGLASGQVHGLLAFPIALVSFWIKSRVEEQWMTAEFGERYATYKKTTWALIPYLL
jgi:protein-S-isoprenylcysteine O-methyltransferase Ste14